MIKRPHASESESGGNKKIQQVNWNWGGRTGRGHSEHVGPQGENRERAVGPGGADGTPPRKRACSPPGLKPGRGQHCAGLQGDPPAEREDREAARELQDSRESPFLVQSAQGGRLASGHVSCKSRRPCSAAAGEDGEPATCPFPGPSATVGNVRCPVPRGRRDPRASCPLTRTVRTAGRGVDRGGGRGGIA